MCIVVYKPKDINLPAYETLEECFKCNKDGAGYMFVKDNKVVIRKGYNDFTKFYEHLTRDYMENNSPFVMHFRISTHGLTNMANTHPFPVSKNMIDLTMLDFKTDIGVAHNGIFSFCKKDDLYSDTMRFIVDYLALMIRSNNKYYENNDYLQMISNIVKGSRVAILSSDGHCELFGEFIEDDGCYYSNSTYKKYTIEEDDDDNYDLIYKDYWERCYDEKTGEYDFSDKFCPFSCEDCSLFCECCSYKHQCRFYCDRYCKEV